MDITLQKTLAKSAMSYLNMAVITNHNPLKINFRCPVCGDSKKSKTKCRGWIYQDKQSMKFGCFNCNSGNYLAPFVKQFLPSLWNDFRIEYFESRINKKTLVKQELKPTTRKMVLKEFDLKNVNNLSAEHIVIKYLENRKIPKSFYNEIFYVEKWKKYTDTLRPNIHKSMDNDYHRIVFPLKNIHGLFGVQGRALDDYRVKYQTILTSDNSLKIWGMHRVDPKKTIFVLEGVIDSLFIVNSIAMLGGSINPKTIPYGNKVFILDNEPRHKDTIKRLSNLINSGEQVVIWLNCPFIGKDVNEMVINGANIIDINRYIWKNVYSGLMAKLKLDEWKKI